MSEMSDKTKVFFGGSKHDFPQVGMSQIREIRQGILDLSPNLEFTNAEILNTPPSLLNPNQLTYSACLDYIKASSVCIFEVSNDSTAAGMEIAIAMAKNKYILVLTKYYARTSPLIETTASLTHRFAFARYHNSRHAAWLVASFLFNHFGEAISFDDIPSLSTATKFGVTKGTLYIQGNEESVRAATLIERYMPLCGIEEGDDPKPRLVLHDGAILSGFDGIMAWGASQD